MIPPSSSSDEEQKSNQDLSKQLPNLRGKKKSSNTEETQGKIDSPSTPRTPKRERKSSDEEIEIPKPCPYQRRFSKDGEELSSSEEETDNLPLTIAEKSHIHGFVNAGSSKVEMTQEKKDLPSGNLSEKEQSRRREERKGAVSKHRSSSGRNLKEWSSSSTSSETSTTHSCDSRHSDLRKMAYKKKKERHFKKGIDENSDIEFRVPETNPRKVEIKDENEFINSVNDALPPIQVLNDPFKTGEKGKVTKEQIGLGEFLEKNIDKSLINFKLFKKNSSPDLPLAKQESPAINKSQKTQKSTQRSLLEIQGHETTVTLGESQTCPQSSLLIREQQVETILDQTQNSTQSSTLTRTLTAISGRTQDYSLNSPSTGQERQTRTTSSHTRNPSLSSPNVNLERAQTQNPPKQLSLSEKEPHGKTNSTQTKENLPLAGQDKKTKTRSGRAQSPQRSRLTEEKQPAGYPLSGQSQNAPQQTDLTQRNSSSENSDSSEEQSSRKKSCFQCPKRSKRRPRSRSPPKQ